MLFPTAIYGLRIIKNKDKSSSKQQMRFLLAWYYMFLLLGSSKNKNISICIEIVSKLDYGINRVYQTSKSLLHTVNYDIVSCFQLLLYWVCLVYIYKIFPKCITFAWFLIFPFYIRNALMQFSNYSSQRKHENQLFSILWNMHNFVMPWYSISPLLIPLRFLFLK